MPIFDYNCHKCGKVADVWAHISEELKTCPNCGLPMIRLFSPPTRIICDITPYFDENLSGQDGKPVWVESRQHKKALLKERGLDYRR